MGGRKCHQTNLKTKVIDNTINMDNKPKTVDIKTVDIITLKAAVYDQNAIILQAQDAIKFLNNEIASRNKPTETGVTPVEVKKEDDKPEVKN